MAVVSLFFLFTGDLLLEQTRLYRRVWMIFRAGFRSVQGSHVDTDTTVLVLTYWGSLNDRYL